MKTTISLITNRQLKMMLQLIFGKSSAQYSFQPLPSYWEMKPAGREMMMHANKK